MPDLSQLTQFLGRLHVAVLHVPIGLLVAVAACEIAALARRKPLDPATRSVLAAVAALTGLSAAGAGWLLASEPGYAGQTLTLHRWLGVALAAAMFLMLAGALARKARLYAPALLIALVLAAPVGHLGGEMTHGPGYLTAPFRGTDATAAGSVYDTEIAPIFAAKCVSCHGESKRRGGLALHTEAALREGGDTGPAFVPGDTDASEIVWRITLPPDDEYHMPPEDKPQLTDAEIDAVVRWIVRSAEAAGPP